MAHAGAGIGRTEALEGQLDKVATRLAERHSMTGEDDVRAVRGLVSEAALRFADARVLTFVPILVERVVHRRLGTEAHLIAG